MSKYGRGYSASVKENGNLGLKEKYIILNLRLNSPK